MYIALYKYMYL